MIEKIAKVLVDGPFDGPLDYLVNPECSVVQGSRCIVPLGRRQIIGIVSALTEESQIDKRKLKSIIAVPDDVGPLKEDWLHLTAFASRYYLGSWGKAAVNSLPKFFRSLPNSAHEKALARFRKEQKTKTKPKAVVLPEPTAEQTEVIRELSSMKGFQPCLLFGVTGSGKTEVYLRLIQKHLSEDKEAQILLMVPEINLTPQLVQRVKDRFPEELVSVWHSAMAEGKKARAWLDMHERRSRILIGTRLSVFASIPGLSLIVIDEEHDTSFKSQEGLRYSARDLAIKRAQLLGILIILGSATPSFETFHNALKGTYKLFRLKKRAKSTASFPSLELVNLKTDTGKDGLSERTQDCITEELSEKRQTLVFLNRRGYAPVVMCNSCGWVSMCPHCSAYAVFHKTTKRLTCHHCGWSVPMFPSCPSCGSVELIPVGRGTQRIEEAIHEYFPQARVLRIDQDSTRTRGSMEVALDKVHAGEVDILLGTQMLAKGHDFQRIGLVVILNIDGQLLSADLRARERLFSVLMQVSGRAGRGELKGRTIVQTRFVNDSFFTYLAKQDFENFAIQELEARKETGMPPYTCLSLMVAEGEGLNEVIKFLTEVKHILQSLNNAKVRIYDPVPQVLARKQDIDRGQLLIEADNKVEMQRFLQLAFAQLKAIKAKFYWYIDVDPLYF